MKVLRLLTVLSIFAFTSCETNPCDQTECLNNGYCIDGTCECPEWYTGENCGQEERSLYYGTYNGNTTYKDLDGNIVTSHGQVIEVAAGNGLQQLDAGELTFNLKNSGSTEFNVPTATVFNALLGNATWTGIGYFDEDQLLITGTTQIQGLDVTFVYSGSKQ